MIRLYKYDKETNPHKAKEIRIFPHHCLKLITVDILYKSDKTPYYVTTISFSMNDSPTFVMIKIPDEQIVTLCAKLETLEDTDGITVRYKVKDGQNELMSFTVDFRNSQNELMSFTVD